MTQSSVHLFITGRVQGVYYRSFTKKLASKLRLNGWVRNLSDGRVEALIEGERSLIDSAILELKQGPPGSYVSDVEVRWEEGPYGLQRFEIRY